MKIIAGLGNPGARYASTRHNVGWWLLDHLADTWQLGRFRAERDAAVATGRVGEQSVRLVRPSTFMNLSGRAIAPLARMAGVDTSRDLLVIVDEVALEPGRARFRGSGSAGGHNGLKSVETTLGGREYARLRIGVGDAPEYMDRADYVLSRPSREERSAILDLFPNLAEGIELWMRDGIEAAMNHCNR